MSITRTMTSKTVAAALGLSASTIARYARESRVPFSTTPGGHRRFSIDEVRDALNTESRINLTPIATSGLINVAGGDTPERSTADAYVAAIRTVHSGSRSATASKADTLVDLFGDSPRVLVGTPAR